MKIKPEQIERIASQLVANYHDQDLIVAKADDGALKKDYRGHREKFCRGRSDRRRSAQDARIAQHRASRDVDPYKMFLLGEAKLAAKRGFIL